MARDRHIVNIQSEFETLKAKPEFNKWYIKALILSSMIDSKDKKQLIKNLIDNFSMITSRALKKIISESLTQLDLPDDTIKALVTKEAIDLISNGLPLAIFFNDYRSELIKLYQSSRKQIILGFANEKEDPFVKIITQKIDRYRQAYADESGLWFRSSDFLIFSRLTKNTTLDILGLILTLALISPFFEAEEVLGELRFLMYGIILFSWTVKILAYALFAYQTKILASENEKYIELRNNIQLFVEIKEKNDQIWLETNLEQFIADADLLKEPLLQDAIQLPSQQDNNLERTEVSPAVAMTAKEEILDIPRSVKEKPSKASRKPCIQQKDLKVTDSKPNKEQEKPYFFKEKNGTTKKIYVNPFINVQNCVLYKGKSALENINPRNLAQFEAILNYPKTIPPNSRGVNGLKPGQFKFYSNSGIIQTEGFSGKVTKAIDHDRLKIVKKGQIEIHYPDDSVVKTQSLYKCVGTM